MQKLKEKYVTDKLKTLMPSTYVNKRDGFAHTVKSKYIFAVFCDDDIYLAPDHTGLNSVRFIKVSPGSFDILFGRKLIKEVENKEYCFEKLELHDTLTVVRMKYYEQI